MVHPGRRTWVARHGAEIFVNGSQLMLSHVTGDERPEQRFVMNSSQLLGLISLGWQLESKQDAQPRVSSDRI